MEKKIRVLIVDDQAIVREILTKGLAMDPEIDVIGTAPDPYIARDKIVYLEPDVITLDVEMPRMNGLEFLRKLMPQYPLPVIMVSSLTKRGKKVTIDALRAGALDFVAKPDGGAGSLETMLDELIQKVKIAARADLGKWLKKKDKPKIDQVRGTPKVETKESYNKIVNTKIKLIALGASTGGTTAFREIIRMLPNHIPGLVVVQHMPEGFTKTYADSLNQESHFDVKEAENGDMVVPDRILIARGDQHMAVKKYGSSYKVNIFSYEKVSGHRPSVDVLFNSVAETDVGKNSIGVILTGMGRDGAMGLAKMRSLGSRTVGQNEESSVVYGMPKVAFDLGGVEKQAPLDNIAGEIVRML